MNELSGAYLGGAVCGGVGILIAMVQANRKIDGDALGHVLGGSVFVTGIIGAIVGGIAGAMTNGGIVLSSVCGAIAGGIAGHAFQSRSS